MLPGVPVVERVGTVDAAVNECDISHCTAATPGRKPIRGYGPTCIKDEDKRRREECIPSPAIVVALLGLAAEPTTELTLAAIGLGLTVLAGSITLLANGPLACDDTMGS